MGYQSVPPRAVDAEIPLFHLNQRIDSLRLIGSSSELVGSVLNAPLSLERSSALLSPEDPDNYNWWLVVHENTNTGHVLSYLIICNRTSGEVQCICCEESSAESSDSFSWVGSFEAIRDFAYTLEQPHLQRAIGDTSHCIECGGALQGDLHDVNRLVRIDGKHYRVLSVDDHGIRDCLYFFEINLKCSQHRHSASRGH